MIRPATEEDIPALVEMGRGFYAQSGAWPDLVVFDAGSVTATLRHLITSPDGILLTAEQGGSVVGMAGALLHPLWLNTTHRTGQELFWFVAPEHRQGLGGHLLKALEDAAKAAGAQSFTMICEAELRADALGRVYRRSGYRPTERAYMKGL
ncbi:N-acetyltransferase family protein [Azospirillum argentinense]